MGVRERRREKEKEKVVSEPDVEEASENPETIDETSKETHRPDIVINTTESVEAVEDKEIVVTAEPSAELEVSRIMPQWGGRSKSRSRPGIPGE